MSPVAPLPESHPAAASTSTSTNGSAGSKPHRPLAPPPIVTNGSSSKGASGRSPPR